MKGKTSLGIATTLVCITLASPARAQEYNYGSTAEVTSEGFIGPIPDYDTTTGGTAAADAELVFGGGSITTDTDPDLGESGRFDFEFDGDGALDILQETVTGPIDGAIGSIDGLIDGALGDATGILDSIRGASSINDVIGIAGDIAGFIGSALGGFGIVDAVQDAIGGLLNIFSQSGLEELLDADLFSIFTRVDSLLGNGQTASTDSVGVLGIPDPEVLERNINAGTTRALEEILATRQGGSGSPVIKQDASMVGLARAAHELAASSALTKRAQERVAANGDVVSGSMDTSASLYEDSLGQDVTQNIMRNISGQLMAAQQTATIGALAGQVQQRSNAYGNMLSAAQMELLHRQDVAKRRETASAYSAVLTQGGQFVLPGFETPED